MARTATGVTIGSHSLRAVKLQRKGDGSYQIQRVFSDRVNDETRPASGRALSARGFGSPVTVGLTGRDVIIRYSQVPPVPEWRLRTLMKYEVDEVGSQSGGDVSADYRRLNLPDPDGERGDDTILVALARNAYLDRLGAACGSGGIRIGGACPNSVALFNAFAVNATYSEDETALLVNIGAEDMDVAIQQGGELLFARNATPGGRAFTEAIQQAFNTSAGKAEQMKLSKADVTPKGQARYPDSTAEKVANAIMGVAGQLSSLIQSTLMIARAQVKLPDLKIDRVLLAGGGASLKGLDLYLRQAMGVPVERLDPFAISDLSQLSAEDRALVEAAPHEFAVAVGLAQSRLDPLAFPLEVLPAAVKRQREFLQKTIWSIAAAVVAALILVVLYMGRKDAVAETQSAKRGIDRARREAESADRKFRDVLKSEQELLVKHELLADTMAPGTLLARTWDVLETSLADPLARDVYLESVLLRVDQHSNEFEYYRELSDDWASGYRRTRLRHGERHMPDVVVVGRIAGRGRADEVYAHFVDGCKAKAAEHELVVETKKRLSGGRAGGDSTFELLFLPGVLIETQPDEDSELEASQIHLTDLGLDDPQDPMAITGRRPDGVRIEIPIEALKMRRADKTELIDRLRAQAPAPASEED